MKIKEFIKKAIILNRKERSIMVNGNLLQISYNIIFDKINICITYLEQDTHFILLLNEQDELNLNLTEDYNLINIIDLKVYYDIIRTIFNEEI